ncbi:MAG: hypothetical protein CL623_05965 [Arcobacter sp.]|nr:hypothetical protein [Arcobacter sp.]|tara:strand:+ start:6894 stop:7124 length:231 start_codon:yes stop_codon:yes gene_type:complete
MFNDLQKELDTSIKSLAENSLLKKLRKQGIERTDISTEKFSELLELEIDIIKSDGKKVGSGVAVGIGISILTGGLF